MSTNTKRFLVIMIFLIMYISVIVFDLNYTDNVEFFYIHEMELDMEISNYDFIILKKEPKYKIVNVIDYKTSDSYIIKITNDYKIVDVYRDRR